MRVCDIITVGANSVHPKRQMVFDDTKISTKKSDNFNYRKGENNMYNNIKLEKGLYSITGKTFTQALAELDPDANYENTELKGLDAFERQLKRFDIKVKGANSDRVEKFFISTESAVLFPEYIRRTVKQGMDEASIMGKVQLTLWQRVEMCLSQLSDLAPPVRLLQSLQDVLTVLLSL